MRILLYTLLLSASCALNADAINGPGKEHEIKAAIIYHILHFVNWPEKSVSLSKKKLVLGILGENPFGDMFDSVRGESIFGKRFDIRFIPSPLSYDKVAGCHALYISQSETEQLTQIISILKGSGAITISDIEQFIDRGGMVGLVPTGGKIRFEINKTSIDGEKIKIAARVLRLATRLR